MKKVPVVILIWLLFGLQTFFTVKQVKSDWTWTEPIYIRSDGSIEPASAPISTFDNVTYTMIDNIVGNVPEFSSSIVVERSDIVFDGVDHILQGSGTSFSRGLNIPNQSNVTVQNTNVRNFSYGIYLKAAFHNTLAGNTLTEIGYGIYLEEASNNTIVGNNLTNNGGAIWIFYHGDNNTIQGNTIAHNDRGIETNVASYNTIADNLITDTWGRAIHLDDISHYNRLLRNNITDGGTGVYLDSGSAFNIFRNNSIAGNWYNIGTNTYHVDYIEQDIDPSNTVDGKPIYFLVNRSNEQVPSDAGYVALVKCTNMTVEGLELRNNLEGILFAGTHNSTIRNNTLANNFNDGKFVYSYNNSIYHNNFMNYGYPYFLDGSSNIMDDGYPSGGNFWDHYNGTDLFNGPNQNVTGSDGIGDTPYQGSSYIDHFPLMKPYQGSHDIGVKAINTSKTIFGQGYSLSINITVLNYGISTENFNLTAHANTTILGTFTNITLPSRTSTALPLTWNTTTVTMGNYTISVEVTPVPGETDLTDNTVVAPQDVCVTISGDVDADFDVDIFDAVLFCDAYGSTPSDPNWNCHCDIVEPFGLIDLFDVVLMADNYGEEYQGP